MVEQVMCPVCGGLNAAVAPACLSCGTRFATSNGGDDGGGSAPPPTGPAVGPISAAGIGSLGAMAEPTPSYVPTPPPPSSPPFMAGPGSSPSGFPQPGAPAVSFGAPPPGLPQQAAASPGSGLPGFPQPGAPASGYGTGPPGFPQPGFDSPGTAAPTYVHPDAVAPTGLAAAVAGSGAAAVDPSDLGSTDTGWSVRPQRGQSPLLLEMPAAVRPEDAPLRGLPPMSGATPPAYPGYQAGPWSQPSGQRRSGGANTFIRLAVLVGVAALVALAVNQHWWTRFTHTSHTVAAPATLNGLPKFPSTELDSLATTFKGQYSKDGVTDALMTAYGVGTPQVLLFAVSADKDLSAHRTEFVTGFNQGFQGAGGTTTSTTTDQTVNGTTYSCLGISVAAHPAVACYWLDYNVFGMVMEIDTSDTAAVAKLTDQAKAAAEH